jgi:hypothetical protein
MYSYVSIPVQAAVEFDRIHSNVVKGLKTGYKQSLRAMGKRDATEMQASFLAKNTRKLAKIIELKNNLQGEPKILHARAGRGVFEGEIQFTFTDGSKFNVRNKIVVKTSVHGRQFLQFPTTFHDAKLANGKFTPGQPSEKEMIEVFAGGSAADVSGEDNDD